ncbi:hypothetical protein [Kitasatospora sp. NPDC097691]|uniref:hypothetical protein n=1 Tax=Kitasatospora sp. NPDC097691 TaxID=3157231 RepID=UPI003323D37E
MSGKYLIMPDQDHGGSWDFTPEQLDQALHGNWPHARLVGPIPRFNVYTLSVPYRDELREFSYFDDRKFFSFSDQDPIDFPFRVVFTLLIALAPKQQVMWTDDFGGDVHYADLSAGIHQLLRPFQ